MACSIHSFRFVLSTDDTFPGSTGSATELRYLMGGDEDLMDHACDIILRERVEESETRHRKGHVCGRKISVVKTPSIWVTNKASCCCFSSKVKSTNDQMLDCASLVFPGPHAFLLVFDNRKVTGNECLKKTINEVFGKEASDYAIVLIIGRTEPKGISSVRKQGMSVYTLEDNEQSVQSLFIKTERMSRNKESTFFIQPSYENLMKKAFLPWEKERDAEIRRETAKHLKEEFAAKTEQHDKEVIELKEKLRIAKSEIKDKEEQHAQKLSELKKTSEITENNLKKDKDNLKCLMLNTYIHLKSKDGQQKDEPGSIAHKSLLNQELEACIHNQADFTHMFSSIIDGYIHRENELKDKLKESELNKDTLRNVCSSILDDFTGDERVKEENKKLQKEVDQLKTIERELKQTLREKENREADLDRREADVTRRENELKAKEREMAERDTHLSGSESNICHGGEYFYHS